MAENESKQAELSLTMDIPEHHLKHWRHLAAEDDTTIDAEIQSLIDDYVFDRILNAGLTLPADIAFDDLGLMCSAVELPEELQDEDMTGRGFALAIRMDVLDRVCEAHEMSLEAIKENEGGTMKVVGALYLDHLQKTGKPDESGTLVLGMLLQTQTRLRPLYELISSFEHMKDELNQMCPHHVAERLVELAVENRPMAQHRH
ncbi:MAG: hypothetical protein AWU57_281 [Marinobacter sp. T13-3]|nr:MAG: hypothetical protein AWU57_281 [Marinobacter sp. T13-3]